jgi:hypothetical protein
LRAGPPSTLCEECEVDRLLAAGRRAIDPRHADDEAEICIRGETP